MSYKIEHNLNSRKGLPNSLIVKENGGYATADTSLLKMNDDLSLFYVYLNHISSIQHYGKIVEEENYFLYSIEQESLWTNIGLEYRYFMKKLQALIDAGYITKIKTISRGNTLYKTNGITLHTKLAIPLLFLHTPKLTWTNKIRFFKLLLTLQMSNTETYKFLPTTNKSKNPMTGLTGVALTELTQELIKNGFVNPNDRLISTESVLLNISVDVTAHRVINEWNLTAKLKKANAEIKKLKRQQPQTTS
jgi:hypothetical protein